VCKHWNSLLTFGETVSIEKFNLEEESIFFRPGNVPLILTVPHGGWKTYQKTPERISGCKIPDDHTYEVTMAILKEFAKTGVKPYTVLGTVHRKYCDLNRELFRSLESTQVIPYHLAYHHTIKHMIHLAKKKNHCCGFPRCLLVDIHGQSTEPSTIFRGTLNGRTVTHLVESFGKEAFYGPHSLLGHIHNGGCSVFPDNYDHEHLAYNGGYTVRAYGSHNKEGVDAIQTEIGYAFRKNEEQIQLYAARFVKAAIVFFSRYMCECSNCHCNSFSFGNHQ